MLFQSSVIVNHFVGGRRYRDQVLRIQSQIRTVSQRHDMMNNRRGDKSPGQVSDIFITPASPGHNKFLHLNPPTRMIERGPVFIPPRLIIIFVTPLLAQAFLALSVQSTAGAALRQ